MALQIFEDQEHHRIRTINLDGAVWFFAGDVCEALEIKNPRDALARLDDDEKRTVGSADSSAQASRTNPSIISESGLYNLIFQSRKPDARLFRKWVTSGGTPTAAGVREVRITASNADGTSTPVTVAFGILPVPYAARGWK